MIAIHNHPRGWGFLSMDDILTGLREDWIKYMTAGARTEKGYELTILKSLKPVDDKLKSKIITNIKLYYDKYDNVLQDIADRKITFKNESLKNKFIQQKRKELENSVINYINKNDEIKIYRIKMDDKMSIKSFLDKINILPKNEAINENTQVDQNIRGKEGPIVDDTWMDKIADFEEEIMQQNDED